MKKKILIISGGISKERIISLETGRQVARELKKNNYRVKICEPDKDFISGDVGIGSDSGAQYAVDRIISDEFNDKYDKGSEIETAADDLIDFSEGNPFGTF